MAASLITDAGLKLVPLQATVFDVQLSPVEDCSAWVDVKLTVREDPLWPRDTADEIAAFRDGGIDVSDWEVVVESTAFSVVAGPAGQFRVSVPAACMTVGVGRDRYVLDIWRRDAGSEWQVVGPHWVSGVPSVVS